ncbi:conserved hypothetical protein [Gammaproteobacteria bacterium]
MSGDWQDHRVLMALASLVLMGGVIVAAFNILPWFPGNPDAAYVTLGSINAYAGGGPVFVLDDDLFPHQCGKAHLTPTGGLDLFAYADPVCRNGVATLRPYLMAADLRVPWAVVPKLERKDLSHLAGQVIAQWEEVGYRLIHSSFFEQSYAPVIKDILRGAFRQAWVSPATSQALARAAETFDRRQVDRVIEGIIPVFLEKAKKNLWQTLRSYTEAVLSGEDKANQDAMAQLGAEVFADPRVHAHLAQTFPPLLTSREVMIVGAVMAKESGKAIFDDSRTLPLLGRLLTDQHFLSLQPFSVEAEHLVRVLPVRLMRLRHRLDHNPLATYVLRAMVRARRDFLVLLLSPQQERQLADSDLPPGPALRRIEPPITPRR